MSAGVPLREDALPLSPGGGSEKPTIISWAKTKEKEGENVSGLYNWFVSTAYLPRTAAVIGGGAGADGASRA